MKIYRLQADMDGYHTLFAPDGAGREVPLRFDGSPRSAGWIPLKVAVWRNEEVPEDLKLSDFPSMTVPVFSRRSVEGLWDLLEPNGEVLPLVCNEGDYFAYNITTLSEALDEDRSRMSRYSDGQIMNVKQHVFKPDLLERKAIFKLVQIPGLWEYVTEEFVQRVQELGLVGFEFKLVWEG